MNIFGGLLAFNRELSNRKAAVEFAQIQAAERMARQQSKLSRFWSRVDSESIKPEFDIIDVECEEVDS